MTKIGTTTLYSYFHVIEPHWFVLEKLNPNHKTRIKREYLKILWKSACFFVVEFKNTASGRIPCGDISLLFRNASPSCQTSSQQFIVLQTRVTLKTKIQPLYCSYTTLPRVVKVLLPIGTKLDNQSLLFREILFYGSFLFCFCNTLPQRNMTSGF